MVLVMILYFGWSSRTLNCTGVSYTSVFHLFQQVLTVPWPLIAEARVQSLVSACGIWDDEIGTGTGF